MKRIFFIISLVLLSITVSAQKEHYNWYFGDKAGLTWKTQQSYTAEGLHGTPSTTLASIPTAISSSAISTSEGCFSISDVSGNTMFYSNGIKLYNKNDVVMQNGDNLTGHSSSAQSGIVIPYPGQTHKYIAVTLGYSDQNSLCYSVVDMSLDNGLGGVVEGQKNIQLTGHSGYLGESLTAVRHSNREDFWIIAPSRGATTYLNVWKVTRAGVQQSRHSATVVPGINTSGDTGNPNGYITFNNAGNCFAWNLFIPNFFVFGTFDNQTGQFTSVKKRSRRENLAYGYGYGALFSKSGNYLYLSNVHQYPSGSSLLVYNFPHLLNAANPEDIYPIRSIDVPRDLSTDQANHFTALVMGPDGYIYSGCMNTNNMMVITNPEEVQTNPFKIYKLNGILGPNIVNLGLPTFAAPWFRFQLIPPPESIACNRVSTLFNLQISEGEGYNDMKSIVVDFGDNKPDSKLTIQDFSPGNITFNHIYETQGEYTVSIKAYDQFNNLMQGMDRQTTIKVKSCMLPVNPNIHQH
ncbi:hypothetical protein JGH11_11245 [Dysgonomonas sp. Marseille-P4677]|uniref:hypothetical protein n=1 Tax=Dysgonomonas sp. Marseille-P4677 TaxID=2364790 RepID=UPI00191476FC|nr:hypothetical protein [Dysgonomonas sp. Marseille-P4677]MBK5721448.1 hypothetical protein [Dysgonomonas sp. Marseille-P4677]